MIAAAESDVSRFDTVFQESERESEVASQAVARADADLDREREERKEIKARFDEEMNERHDLQVRSRPPRVLYLRLTMFCRLSNAQYANI